MDLLCLKGDGLGHLTLFSACCTWLDEMAATEKLDESTYLVLSYMVYVLNTFKSPVAAPYETDGQPRANEDDDTTVDQELEPIDAKPSEFDTDSADLNSKLCTFTVSVVFDPTDCPTLQVQPFSPRSARKSL
jgi:hypothetical protein